MGTLIEKFLPSPVPFPETFSVNFGLKADDQVIWVASNQYVTYGDNSIYRGAILTQGWSLKHSHLVSVESDVPLIRLYL